MLARTTINLSEAERLSPMPFVSEDGGRAVAWVEIGELRGRRVRSAGRAARAGRGGLGSGRSGRGAAADRRAAAPDGDRGARGGVMRATADGSSRGRARAGGGRRRARIWRCRLELALARRCWPARRSLLAGVVGDRGRDAGAGRAGRGGVLAVPRRAARGWCGVLRAARVRRAWWRAWTDCELPGCAPAGCRRSRPASWCACGRRAGRRWRRSRRARRSWRCACRRARSGWRVIRITRRRGR